MQIIPRILIGFIGTVVSLACYLAYFGTSDTESGQSVWSRIAKTKAKPVERKPKENVFTKYIILAMAKRNVYQFASPGDIPDAKVQKKKKKLERWAKQMIANSGRILDALEPNAFKLNKIVDDAGDLVDKAYVNAKVCKVVLFSLFSSDWATTSV